MSLTYKEGIKLQVKSRMESFEIHHKYLKWYTAKKIRTNKEKRDECARV